MKRVPANPTGTATLLYNPHQVAFLEALRARLPNGKRMYKRLSLVAGRRGGKTEIGGLAAVEEALIPNTIGWVCAPSYEKLYEAVWPAVFRYVPESMIDTNFHNSGWSEQHQELVLTNGSRIRGRSLDNPERGRGSGLDWVWIDEAREISEKAWDFLRPALTEKGGAAWVTTSPNGYDWVYERFMYPAMPGPKHEDGWWNVIYPTSANPWIPRDDIALAKREMSEEMFAQEYMADLVSFRGAIYGTRVRGCLLNSDEEVKRYIPSWPNIPPELECRVGIDPGSSKEHPYAAVFGVLTEDGLVVFDEYWNNDGIPSLIHARDIMAKTPRGSDVRYVIDKQRKTDQIELAQHGLHAAKAENDVFGGIDRVKSWMERGKLKIVRSRCPRLTEELQTYRTKDTMAKDGDVGLRPKPHKAKDDTCDALRYLCMSWPALPGAEVVTLDGRDLKKSPIRPQDMAMYLCEKKAEKMYKGGDMEEMDLLPVDSPDYPMGQFFS